MELATLIVSSLCLALVLYSVMASQLMKRRATAIGHPAVYEVDGTGRQASGMSLAATATGAAEQQAGRKGHEKMRDAVAVFARLDLAQHGRRCFSDAEARIFIESALQQQKRHNDGPRSTT